MSTILYKKHKNSIGYWSIWHNENTIHIQYATCIDCLPQEVIEVVHEGKQSRTIIEQVKHRIQSRINKQLDKGYKRTKTEAESSEFVTDASGNLKPMLALPIKRVSSYINDSYIQLKYNGHRMLVVNAGGTLRAYSRRGKPIDTVPHILRDIDIPEGMVLDGELYHHGTPLQTIASWAKRAQDNTKKLTYIIYDTITTGIFAERLRLLKSSEVQLSEPCVIAKSVHLSRIKSIHALLQTAKSSGYEGLILRQNNRNYEVDRRSASLLKIKSVLDDEFLVIDIIPSKDGWGILVCKTESDKIFKVSAPGSIKEKEAILRHKDVFIGRMVKIEYSELTKDRIPFHPVAIEFFTQI